MARRWGVVAALLGASSLVTLADAVFRSQYLMPGWGVAVADGILFPPLVVAAAIYGGSVGGTAFLVVNQGLPRTEDERAVWLGSAWALASIPLVFDYLIDSFEPKLVVAFLFVLIAVRYWRGHRNSYLSLLLAPFVAFIAAGDALEHTQGGFCAQTGFDACPVKAVSDIYLVLILLLLTYLTIAGRSSRPKPLPLLVSVGVVILIMAAFLLLS